MRIEDGEGNGKFVGVDSKKRLKTLSTTQELQHSVSEVDHQAFQVSTDVAITAAAQPILLLKNTSDTKNLTITFIRLETVGAPVLEAASFFEVMSGGTYTSGGDAIVPINTYVGNAVSATGDFYDVSTTPLVVADFSVLDKTHSATNSQITYNKHGSLILPKNAALLIRYTSGTVQGNVLARVSFYYDEH